MTSSYYTVSHTAYGPYYEQIRGKKLLVGVWVVGAEIKINIRKIESSETSLVSENLSQTTFVGKNRVGRRHHFEVTLRAYWSLSQKEKGGPEKEKWEQYIM